MFSLVQDHPGELAALATAWFWVFTSLAFAAAGRRVGPTVVNLIRIFLAVVLLGALHRVLMGTWVPRPDIDGLWYLALSGVIGLSIGDQFLFTALVHVGSRMTTLLMTLAPVVAAALAWPMLDEHLSLQTILGMTITIGGIIWVVLEKGDRRPAPSAAGSGSYAWGVFYGAMAAVCQAVGLVLGKLGIGHTRLESAAHVDPLAATLVRMTFALLGIIVLALVVRRVVSRRQVEAAATAGLDVVQPRRSSGDFAAKLRRAAPFIIIGTVLGPVLGVWCSMVAIDLADAAIAATLMAMTPVFILPFARVFEKDRITPRAAVGAIVAVIGVVLLTV